MQLNLAFRSEYKCPGITRIITVNDSAAGCSGPGWDEFNHLSAHMGLHAAHNNNSNTSLLMIILQTTLRNASVRGNWCRIIAVGIVLTLRASRGTLNRGWRFNGFIYIVRTRWNSKQLWLTPVTFSLQTIMVLLLLPTYYRRNAAGYPWWGFLRRPFTGLFNRVPPRDEVRKKVDPLRTKSWQQLLGVPG